MESGWFGKHRQCSLKNWFCNLLCQLSYNMVQQTANWDCTFHGWGRVYCYVSHIVWDHSSSESHQKDQLYFSHANSNDWLLHHASWDHLSAIAMAKSLKFTPQTKHIAIKYHHFCSRVHTSSNKSGDIKIKYISTKKQLADIFTKPVDSIGFFAHSGWWYHINPHLFTRECDNAS